MGAFALKQATLRHIGLLRPYRFDRLLAAFTALLLTVVIVIVGAVFALTGELDRYTPRETYFVYLMLLALAGALLAAWPRLSTVALALCTIDLGLGLSSFALEKASVVPSSIMPQNFNVDRRFEWHPLLQVVPIPSITVPVSGFQVSHSSQGTRGRDHDGKDLTRKTVIATFGGSATYDIGVGDDDTWPAQLEDQLGGGRFAVVNHGVPGYSTVEHLVQTAFYQRKFGAKPHCAIYFIGWNDIRNAHIAGIDPGYARYHLRSLIDALQARRYGGSYQAASPLLTLAVRLISLETETIGPPREIDGEPQTGSDPTLEALYVRNIRSISAINRDRGIRTIWVGQVLNLAKLEDGNINGWIPLVRNRDVWPLLDRFNQRLAHEASVIGDAFIDVPITAFTPEDFYDNGHFLASGSAKLAGILAPRVARECR